MTLKKLLLAVTALAVVGLLVLNEIVDDDDEPLSAR
jgi:hypothetical protein